MVMTVRPVGHFLDPVQLPGHSCGIPGGGIVSYAQ